VTAQLARAELHALKMQIHPHFLFNTLHSISSLVLEDAPKANR
jgi:two-component system LytT family sensor kinase